MSNNSIHGWFFRRRKNPSVDQSHSSLADHSCSFHLQPQTSQLKLSRHTLPRRISSKSLITNSRHASFSTYGVTIGASQHGSFAARIFGPALPVLPLLAILALASESAARPQSPSPQEPSPSATDTKLEHRPARNEKLALSESVTLTVPKGTPVQVALDEEVQIRKVGQPLHGRVVEPVYAFDKLVIPVGSQVTGQVTKIEPVSKLTRTTSALNADFTPMRKIDVEFNELALPDGKHLPISTIVTPGSGQVIQFVSAEDANKKKSVKGETEAEDKASQAKQQAKQEWDNALKQIEAPGKVHRLERYAVSMLPVHPQYIDSGTAYFAELQQPLDFGTEPLTPELASSLGATPPEGSVVHARLVTPLSSAIAQKGDDVQAVVSQPLFDDGKLVIPQGSFLKGDVVQVMSARRLSRNGQLRFVFHELVLPDGVDRKIDAVLSGVEREKLTISSSIPKAARKPPRPSRAI
jgi:hypothetical protein